MYNPFPLLNERLLTDKIREGKRFFVRQTYPRGLDGRIRAAFLLRAYTEDEKELAEMHLSTLQHDPNAFLYDAEDAVHLQKLQIASRQPLGYKIFYAGKKGVDWDPPGIYQQKMKNYLRHHHPEWRTRKGSDKVEIGLYEEFGALFLKFSFGREEDQVPFETIENY